jgi:hypothetical protein
MANTKTVAIGEDVWERLKEQALRERVTVRCVLEKAACDYLDARWVARAEKLAEERLSSASPLGGRVKELKYDPESE